MNDRPLINLTFRVRRSVFYEIQEAVKKSGINKSEYLRSIINKEMNSKKNQNERS